MPYNPHDDSQLQKIAILPIPEAVKMLEEIPSEAERHRLAAWLAGFWRGGVMDLQGARKCVAASKLDDPCKKMLAQGLVD
ncbi:MAG TPA: hypothetical protein VGE39_16165 [Prosthecobacter sp.]